MQKTNSIDSNIVDDVSKSTRSGFIISRNDKVKIESIGKFTPDSNVNKSRKNKNIENILFTHKFFRNETSKNSHSSQSSNSRNNKKRKKENTTEIVEKEEKEVIVKSSQDDEPLSHKTEINVSTTPKSSQINSQKKRKIGFIDPVPTNSFSLQTASAQLKKSKKKGNQTKSNSSASQTIDEGKNSSSTLKSRPKANLSQSNKTIIKLTSEIEIDSQIETKKEKEMEIEQKILSLEQKQSPLEASNFVEKENQTEKNEKNRNDEEFSKIPHDTENLAIVNFVPRTPEGNECESHKEVEEEQSDSQFVPMTPEDNINPKHNTVIHTPKKEIHTSPVLSHSFKPNNSFLKLQSDFLPGDFESKLSSNEFRLILREELERQNKIMKDSSSKQIEVLNKRMRRRDEQHQIDKVKIASLSDELSQIRSRCISLENLVEKRNEWVQKQAASSDSQLQIQINHLSARVTELANCNDRLQKSLLKRKQSNETPGKFIEEIQKLQSEKQQFEKSFHDKNLQCALLEQERETLIQERTTLEKMYVELKAESDAYLEKLHQVMELNSKLISEKEEWLNENRQLVEDKDNLIQENLKLEQSHKLFLELKMKYDDFLEEKDNWKQEKSDLLELLSKAECELELLRSFSDEAEQYVLSQSTSAHPKNPSIQNLEKQLIATYDQLIKARTSNK